MVEDREDQFSQVHTNFFWDGPEEEAKKIPKLLAAGREQNLGWTELQMPLVSIFL